MNLRKCEGFRINHGLILVGNVITSGWAAKKINSAATAPFRQISIVLSVLSTAR